MNAPPNLRIWFRRLACSGAAALALLAGAVPLGLADGGPDPDPDPAPGVAAEDSVPARKARSLLGILGSRSALNAELAALQAELDTGSARGREDAILDEIRNITEKLEDLDRSFSELSAELDPGAFADAEDPTAFDLGGELRELLGPLVNELKRFTSRPREMDRLRTEIGQIRDRIETIDEGLQKLALLYGFVKDPGLREALDRERTEWIVLHQELATLYEIDRQKLDQMLSEQTSIGEALEGVFELFFKSRGRNMLLAILATGLFMLLLRKLHDRALASAAMQRQGDALLPRLLNLAFVVVMTIGGVLVFLLVLYLFGDWVLLILMLLLVFGALWASKQAIPRFWTQATLLLNLGPVREGERIVMGGLPFTIERLNFYTDLVNERLTGGRIRLPIGDLTDLRSRPFEETEPFFPTSAGDWVVLSDDTYGQVEVQTPEQVVLLLMGGARKTIPTADFLALTPTNLSGGFMAKLVFNLDYAHLDEITDVIPRRLCDFVEEGLRDSPVAEHIEKVEAFFSGAAASSVDVRVVVSLRGEAADFYKIVPRIVARLCVEACNAYGWSIPFPQLTVHAATTVHPGVGDDDNEGDD